MAGIYIHIPFCRSKCVYCAFYSIVCKKKHSSLHKTAPQQNIIGEYLQTLTKELTLRSYDYKDLNFSTIYFGGGTPSLLKIYEIEHVIKSIKDNYNSENIIEFSFEANPEQLSEVYCKQLKQLGINRLSIGVQSFDDNILNFLGRKHNSKDAANAIKNAKKAGFTNISIDLIYGINERNDTLWLQELNTLKLLDINHFSAYALTLEENSILYKKVKNKQLEPLDEELAKRQYDILVSFAQQSGFQHYEISNFAKLGFESKHNSSYWFGVPYLGFGVSAHSFNGHKRYWNAPTLNDYHKNIENNTTFNDFEKLSPNEKFNEYILLRLRTSKGIDLNEMKMHFETKKVEYLQNYFRTKVRNNFFKTIDNTIHLTSEGFWFADGIASDIFLTD